MSQPAAPCQLRLGCVQETCSCRGRKAPPVSRCCVTLGTPQGTGGAECALGCGAGNAHGLRNWTSCWMPMAGEVENTVLSFLHLSPHQYYFYDSFHGSFHTRMSWIPSGYSSISSSICLAWMWTVSNIKDSVPKLSPVCLRMFLWIGTHCFQLAEIKPAKKISRKLRSWLCSSLKQFHHSTQTQCMLKPFTAPNHQLHTHKPLFAD